jgi:hypothetical protein
MDEIWKSPVRKCYGFISINWFLFASYTVFRNMWKASVTNVAIYLTCCWATEPAVNRHDSGSVSCFGLPCGSPSIGAEWRLDAPSCKWDWLLFVREQGDCGNCNKSDQIKEKLMFVRTSNESRSLRIDRDDAELAPCKRTHIFHFIPTKYILLPN